MPQHLIQVVDLIIRIFFNEWLLKKVKIRQLIEVPKSKKNVRFHENLRISDESSIDDNQSLCEQ